MPRPLTIADSRARCKAQRRVRDPPRPPRPQGYTEEEARALLDQDCGSELRARRQEALKLCAQTKKYLEWQVRPRGRVRLGASVWRHLLPLRTHCAG